VDSELLTEGLKITAGRNRPGSPSPATFSPFSGGSSFPSGHTSFAFAVARVCARRYPRLRVIAYGLAAWVAISRLQQNAHYLSDVLVGSAIGLNAGQRAIGGRVDLAHWKF
jgi:membrane-associated phospholipid phosphatase